jgi:hypothetical protein
MPGPVVEAYHRLDDARPLVRPTYNQFEVTFLPPYGDPEVHLPGELGTYVVAGLCVNAVAKSLHDER